MKLPFPCCVKHDPHPSPPLPPSWIVSNSFSVTHSHFTNGIPACILLHDWIIWQTKPVNSSHYRYNQKTWYNRNVYRRVLHKVTWFAQKTQRDWQTGRSFHRIGKWLIDLRWRVRKSIPSHFRIGGSLLWLANASCTLLIATSKGNL